MNIRLVTPPVEVITTTISTCGWRTSTSTCLIVEVSIGGAVTIASRFVTWDSVSVVTRMASASSRRTRDSDSDGPPSICTSAMELIPTLTPSIGNRTRFPCRPDTG